MKEWTLCADLKVYAGLRAVAKPATHRTAVSAIETSAEGPMISARPTAGPSTPVLDDRSTPEPAATPPAPTVSQPLAAHPVRPVQRRRNSLLRSRFARLRCRLRSRSIA